MRQKRNGYRRSMTAAQRIREFDDHGGAETNELLRTDFKE